MGLVRIFTPIFCQMMINNLLHNISCSWKKKKPTFERRGRMRSGGERHWKGLWSFFHFFTSSLLWTIWRRTTGYCSATAASAVRNLAGDDVGESGYDDRVLCFSIEITRKQSWILMMNPLILFCVSIFFAWIRHFLRISNTNTHQWNQTLVFDFGFKKQIHFEIWN